MTDESGLAEALLIAATIALLFFAVFYAAYRVVTWARRQSKRAYVIGAALAPFMAIGNVVDPDFRIVQEAKQLKKREEDNPGDPPNGDDFSIAPREAPASGEPERRGSRAAVPMPAKSRAWRPVAARAIAFVLGLMALATSVVASLTLFSDFYGRGVRESFSPLEWVSIYLMSALLFASMFQLFRLRKASVRLFAGHLGVAILLSIGHALMQEPSRYLDLRMTFVTVPAALAVLLYMRRLSRQGELV